MGATVDVGSFKRRLAAVGTASEIVRAALISTCSLYWYVLYSCSFSDASRRTSRNTIPMGACQVRGVTK